VEGKRKEIRKARNNFEDQAKSALGGGARGAKKRRSKESVKIARETGIRLTLVITLNRINAGRHREKGEKGG